MTGTALFAPRDGVLHYHEHVLCRAENGRVLDGERRYLFAAAEGGFRVLFAEDPPRLFHHITLHRGGDGLVGHGMHLCGEDRYDSRYEFRADGSFLVRHDVGGPRKNYAMTTRYSRLSSFA